MTSDTPLSGRRAEAARNDERILASARAVFVANPRAPIAAVAEHAGMGISALYRRFSSKEELLRQLCRDGLDVYLAAAQAAKDDMDAGGDVGAAFERFIRAVVEGDSHSLTVNLAGTFVPDDSLYDLSGRAGALTNELFARAQAAGAVRPDLVVEDLPFIFEQLTAVSGPTSERTAELRARYLDLQLAALTTPGRAPLPGPPPTAAEQAARWAT